MRKSIVFSLCLVLTTTSFGFENPDVAPNEPQPMADVVPAPDGAEKKIKHLAAAREHLLAAGMEELATKVSEQLQQEQRALHRGQLTRKLAELQSLREEVDRLRRLADSPAQIRVHVRMIEVDRKKLPVPDQKQAAPNAPLFDDLRDLETLNARIKELVRQGSVKILLAPELMSCSGERCELRTGGEFPVPKPGGVVTASGGGDKVEMQPYGVLVQALPQSLGGNRLRLDILAQVSAPDMSNTVTVHGQTVPSLTVRRINSQVELESGRPCVLGGMRSDGSQGAKELVIILIAQSVPGASK